MKTETRIPWIEMLVTILMAMLIVLIAILYETRTTLIQRFITPESISTESPVAGRLVLSPDSIHRVEAFAASHKELAIVGIVSVDLSTNTRLTVLRWYNDKQIEQQMVSQLKKSPEKEVPLFTSNATNNAEISDLLNGDFTCTTEVNGLFSKQFNLGTTLQTACRIPIPPYYGRLTGYLIVYSKQQMSIYETDQLRREVIRLAVDMYYTDVTRPLMTGE